MRILRGHTHAVRAVAYAPDRPGMLASAGDDRTVRLWDAPSGEPLGAHATHGDSLLSLTFAADTGILISGGRSSSLAWWDVGGGGLAGPRAYYVGWGPVVALAVTADGVLSAHRSTHYGTQA